MQKACSLMEQGHVVSHIAGPNSERIDIVDIRIGVPRIQAARNAACSPLAVSRRCGRSTSCSSSATMIAGTFLVGHEPSTSTKILPSLTSYFARSSALASESTLIAACG